MDPVRAQQNLCTYQYKKIEISTCVPSSDAWITKDKIALIQVLLYITNSSHGADDVQGFNCLPDMNSGLRTKIEPHLFCNKYGYPKHENKSAHV